MRTLFFLLSCCAVAGGYYVKKPFFKFPWPADSPPPVVEVAPPIQPVDNRIQTKKGLNDLPPDPTHHSMDDLLNN